MRLIGADVLSMPENSRTTTNLDSFIRLPTYDHPAALADVTASMVQGLSEVLNDGEEELDAIICANGGWMGDPKLPSPNDGDEEFMAGVQEYGNAINRMLEMNLFPVLAAGYAANRFMADDGKSFATVFATSDWFSTIMSWSSRILNSI